MAENKKKNLILLFVLVALCSFSTGILIGLYSPYSETTHSEPSENLGDNKIENNKTENKLLSNSELNQSLSKNNKESIERYKKMLKKSVESELNPEQTNYGIVVGSYTNRDQANEKAIDLHTQYEDWNITTQEMGSFYKVIIGTFTTQQEAQSFLDKMPKKAEFLKAKIISFTIK